MHESLFIIHSNAKTLKYIEKPVLKVGHRKRKLQERKFKKTYTTLGDVQRLSICQKVYSISICCNCNGEKDYHKLEHDAICSIAYSAKIIHILLCDRQIIIASSAYRFRSYKNVIIRFKQVLQQKPRGYQGMQNIS